MKPILIFSAIFQFAAMAGFLYAGLYGFAGWAGFFGAYSTWQLRRLA